MYITNVNGQWALVPDSYDPTAGFTRTPGLCDKIRFDYTGTQDVVWLRSPTERCVASNAALAHAILGVYHWLARPTRDYQTWNYGSSPPELTNLMKAGGVKTCYTQHCERGYAIAFATEFPQVRAADFGLDTKYKLDIFFSEEDLDHAHWGLFGYFMFDSVICTDSAWPPEA